MGIFNDSGVFGANVSMHIVASMSFHMMFLGRSLALVFALLGNLATGKGKPEPPTDTTGVPLITGSLATGGFQPYAGYIGEFRHVEGRASVRPYDGFNNIQMLQFRLYNIDPKCTQKYVEIIAPTIVNACGIHIHEGKNINVFTGEHLFSSKLQADPWLVVTYTAGTFRDQEKSASQEWHVFTGLTIKDLADRAMTVHDSQGVRIAAGK